MTEIKETSSAFNLLDQRIQRWIWEKKWTGLRDVQEEAIPAVLTGNTDIIIAAATAGGKTEAAFFPICSRLVENGATSGSALYIGPLKALINDQFERLNDLCERLEIPVYPWHGDISGPRKKEFLETKRGIVLITPESLESLFVNQGYHLATVFKDIRYVVVDELHSFMGTVRGKQLQSLMHRLELKIGRPVPRIGLSATLGDMHRAAQFLRPNLADKVQLIVSESSGQELKLILKGFVSRPWVSGETPPEGTSETGSAKLDIARSLFNALRGKSNLVFANSRRNVELYADLLSSLATEARIPNEFFPHHGSLSKALREEAEAEVKDKTTPTTVICTSTLEMGIDIGSVESVAQVGVPPSVASLRQRLGRSGRRGDPAVLRMYIEHKALDSGSDPLEKLRTELVQSISIVRLLLEKWYEPPEVAQLHLSTMIQQVLSIIAERAGARASDLWQFLCESGPFGNLSKSDFTLLLRQMGEKQLLMQSADGLLLHGPVGERIVNHYEFYAAFASAKEYRLVAGGKTIGTLPVDRPVYVGTMIIFAGRRWYIEEIDAARKVILIHPAQGGSPPIFGGEAGEVHDRIRGEMYRVFLENDHPSFLDQTARDLLDEARAAFKEFSLSDKRILPTGPSTYIFPWSGDRIADTMAVIFQASGQNSTNWGIAVEIKAQSAEVERIIAGVLSQPKMTSLELAKSVKDKCSEKYDVFLSEDLLCLEYSTAKLDVDGAYAAFETIINQSEVRL